MAQSVHGRNCAEASIRLRALIFTSDCSLLFGIARAIQDLRIRDTELLFAEASSMVTVTSIAVATMKFPFGKCNYAVDIDVGTGDFSLLLGILLMCGHAHVRSHVSPGMD